MYAVVSSLVGLDEVDHPVGVVVLLALMVVWTVVVSLLLERPARRTPGLLAVDLAVAAAALLSGRLLQGADVIDAGAPSLTLTWGAVPVVAWAVQAGTLGGGLAAVAMGVATVAWRGAVTRPTVGACVLLLLTGLVVGYVVSLAREAESAYAAVVQRETAQAERERLARTVHDGVLQTLALVSRTSDDPRLAALAAEQERALRRLVAGPPVPVPAGTTDLRELLRGSEGVEVAVPATAVPLPAPVAVELAAAVAACLDNVRAHAGGRAWVLVEDEGDAVLVTVRDDGPGIPAGRLARAEAEGRMGLARSVRGRVGDLGGSVLVTSAPGQGTEVELRVPRA